MLRDTLGAITKCPNYTGVLTFKFIQIQFYVLLSGFSYINVTITM